MFDFQFEGREYHPPVGDQTCLGYLVIAFGEERRGESARVGDLVGVVRAEGESRGRREKNGLTGSYRLPPPKGTRSD